MSKIDQYIHKQSKESPEFEAAFYHERKNTELALRLTELRIAAGLTQNQLAKKLVSPSRQYRE